MALQKAAGTAAGTLGIVANPASGKDVRRLVSQASVFDNREKVAIVRRAITGALAAGVGAVRYLEDSHGLTASALRELGPEVDAQPVDVPATASALDTRHAAAALREAGCAAVITLGGDGTNRAFARGWLDPVLMPISTGTNNVFPQLLEGTIAGMAAGFAANGGFDRASCTTRAKVIHARIEDEPDDLALIDAALTNDRFVGSRAVFDVAQLRAAVITRAEPTAIGISAIGGCACPLAAETDAALRLELGAGGRHGITAVIAPGRIRRVALRSIERVALDTPIELEGPGLLAFDGERERTLRTGQRAWLEVRREGPWVIDPEQIMNQAARSHVFKEFIGGGDAQ